MSNANTATRDVNKLTTKNMEPINLTQFDETLLEPIPHRPPLQRQPDSDEHVPWSKDIFHVRGYFMKATIAMVSAGLAIVVATGPLVAQPPLPNARSKARQVAHGKYLVERAVPCADCHTARNKQGELMLQKPLQGAPILFKPTVPIPGWVDTAPNIAGLPGWTDEQAIKFLMTGIAYNDLPASPPMPPFRFNREDATAIVAYLRTLKPAAKARQVEQPRFDH